MTINEPREAFENLPSNEDILAEAYRSPSDPVGIHLEPALAGWPSSNGLDEESFLQRRPIFAEFDVTRIERSRVRVVRRMGEEAVGSSGLAEQQLHEEGAESPT